jgi:hypothetical protein
MGHPWEVMAFASNTGDIVMARYAIMGLEGGEGDKLVNGSWKRGDFAVSTRWAMRGLELMMSRELIILGS